MPQNIYILGNPLLDFDNLPIHLKPELEKAFPNLIFEVIDPNDNLHPDNGLLVIIDTVINIEGPVLIKSIDDLVLSPRYSMHDLDLAFNLKLLAKMGKLERVFIVGLPPDYDAEQGLKKVTEILTELMDSL